MCNKKGIVREKACMDDVQDDAKRMKGMERPEVEMLRLKLLLWLGDRFALRKFEIPNHLTDH
jgi:hypothetical protein